jgi:hypothetical protein
MTIATLLTPLPRFGGSRIVAFMQTWVLVITLISNYQIVGTTSVPGYESPDACARAGRSVEKQLGFATRQVSFDCIDGPSK